MSDFDSGFWVLAAGLAIGAFLTWRLRTSAGRGKKQATAADRKVADRELAIADLESRRDDLLERLRTAADDGLPAGDRERLERSAARAVRDLEAATRRDPKVRRGDARAQPHATAPASTAPPTVAPRGRAGIAGFALGAGLVALIVVLFVWAGEDSRPRAEGDVATGRSFAEDPPHAELEGLSPQATDRVRRLEGMLADNPGDLQARKALAEILIQEGKLFEGYQQSEVVLEQSPGDSDGLYFQGLVRLMMGQSDTAIELLDQAVSNTPDHVSARLVRGLAYMRLDRRDEAIADWEIAYEASGRTHGGLASLLEMARSGKTAEEIFSAPTGGSPQSSDAPDRTGEGAPGFGLRIELADGAQPAPGGTLFVSLRDESLGPGPPAAVRRIDGPRFPIEVSLDERDSMLGRPLPESGTISARLDFDGSASTREDGDLEASGLIARGDTLTLTLSAP